MIDHLDFVGLKQVWRHGRGQGPRHIPFMTRGFYAFVRHPIMLGFLIAFWVTPRMTAGHLLFAVLATAYIVSGTML